MLAHQAWLMSDAIVRTRLFYGTAQPAGVGVRGPVHSGLGLDLRGFYRRMAGAVALAAAAAIAVAWGRPGVPVALPLLVLWVASPALARWISLPSSGAAGVPLGGGRALRLIARRTWRFFAAFVGPDDHAAAR
jgi:cyclic beta-1,2-glucan synthetase